MKRRRTLVPMLACLAAGCVGGLPMRADTDRVPVSCLAIVKAGGSEGDGTYWIDPVGTGPFQVYCDMTTDGGGWTRVVGINATDRRHVTSAEVDPSSMTTATAFGKFADAVINSLKSSEPALRLTCQNSPTPVTG